MRKTILAAAALTAGLTAPVLANALTVGVSWSNFQEERWKTDEAAIKAALEAAGADYISTDAQSSSAKQLSDVESLIAQGADALIILAQDTKAIEPAVQAAADEGIPVIAYDRLIEDRRAFYLTFDNVEVGRMQARAVLAAAPKGNYVMIKGSPTDPNADFLRGGQQEVLQAAIDAGDIKIVGEAYTDGWLPANAQRNMEQILTAKNNKVDAVVASNDGTAGGVVAALTAQGMEGIPVSGQDGDHAALNRVALGTQTVSVWKDARELGKNAGEIAVALAGGTEMAAIDGAREMDLARRDRDERQVPQAGADHQGQPDGCRRCRLDHQGRAVPGRDQRSRALQLSAVACRPMGARSGPRPPPTTSPHRDRGRRRRRTGTGPAPGTGRRGTTFKDIAMSDTAQVTGQIRRKSLFETLELDTRLLGMIGAFVLLCLCFHFCHGRPFPDAAQHLQPDDPDRLASRSWRPAWSSSSSPAISTCRSARCWPPVRR